MIQLLKVELKKITNYRTFWVFITLYAVTLGILALNLRNVFVKDGVNLDNMPILKFPDVWHTATYIAGFFNIILAIFVIISITNEYEFRTIRQNIIDGWSRRDFLIAKLWPIFLLSIGAAMYVFLITYGIGLSNSEDTSFAVSMHNSEFIFAFMFQSFIYLCFAFLLGLLFKKPGIAIGVLLLYSAVIEPLLGFNLPGYIGNYLPVSSIRNIIELPFLKYGVSNAQKFISAQSLIVPGCYGIIFILIASLVLKKKDL
ncbi:hypothetical protein TH53_23755 [Pedobacter lusitanus]|uniref:Uncharacterized protein n=1 Tax=Pedobacter lusitanus TaxID=1503925 RepID=A0A0D0GFJ1_9SPHI|nr:ABC transporter permease [Pedobacter lusitanus]KIO74900.1 hypothetical protein TH53_23755 [Pedobacter lusitanus]